MAWDDGLTGRARDIAAASSARLRVMAGPGTGKSFAIKRRLMRLLESGADPCRILVVTFTRTAAADLVDEIGNLGVAGCEAIVASTLHSYCFRLLTKESVFEFTCRTPRPLVTFASGGVLQFEAAPMLQDLNAPDRFGDKRSRTKRIRAFEAVWARLQSDEPGWALNPIDAEFEKVLNSWLQFHNCMLIGELVSESLHFLRNNPASSERTAFDHVLVDEYQDLNKAEQVLLDLLAENGHQAIVGDADQSIYRFRHAHPDGIVDFGSSHPGTDDHVLDECRRCPKKVVAVADRLIRHNHPTGTATKLVPRPTNADGEIYIVQWESIEDEASGIADFVAHLINRRAFAAKDILILSPRRLIGYKVRDRLVDISIPVHSFYHEEALEEDEAQEAFAALTLLADRNDAVALRFWLGFGSTTWLAAQYQTLRQHCEASGESTRDVLERLVAKTLAIPGTANLQKRFRLLQDRLVALSGVTGLALVDAIFPDSVAWSRSLREAALLAGDAADTPAGLLEYLRTRITQPEMPEEGDFVRVMSLHKSKGLTSRAVIVCGCVEGLVPYREDDATRDEQEAILKEQRRLFYVAITRCTKLLMISSFTTIPKKIAYRIGAKVTGKGATGRTIASRFIREMGSVAPSAVRGPDLLAALK